MLGIKKNFSRYQVLWVLFSINKSISSFGEFSKFQTMLMPCTHTQSCQCSTIYCYAFFPNLPCLSLFLNLPCCISFFFTFPCWEPPLLAMAFPPSNFLFLSLLEVGNNYKRVSKYNYSVSKDPGCYCTFLC